MDFGKIDYGFFGCRMLKFLGFVVILPVLVAELELGESFLLQGLFRSVEFGKGLDAVLAVIGATLIDRDFFSALPAKEGMVAIRAEVF